MVDFDEPFQKLFNQGMITGKNGIKMSKSKGNVVSPDDLVENYGCDSLRMMSLTCDLNIVLMMPRTSIFPELWKGRLFSVK